MGSAAVREKLTGRDYQDRSYLSAIESAKFLNISVNELHRMTRQGQIASQKSGGGQYRYKLTELQKISKRQINNKKPPRWTRLTTGKTEQQIICGNAMRMSEVPDNSVHLIITSPPYFNAKMYAAEQIKNDLGNVHDLDEWFAKINSVWQEAMRVLQPGRKIFINIMNLPIRYDKTFRSINLAGKTIDLMEKIGFIFKRDIIWHKTNGVRAHFGTYPYPGGILINNMHEFILEFNKPAKNSVQKYAHLSPEQKEQSKLSKELWLSIKNSDVWLMKPQASSDARSHVAPFPYELPYRLIKAYSYVSERILDPFAGSCISLRVAADQDRNGIGYEINPTIASAAIQSLRKHQPGIL